MDTQNIGGVWAGLIGGSLLLTFWFGWWGPTLAVGFVFIGLHVLKGANNPKG